MSKSREEYQRWYYQNVTLPKRQAKSAKTKLAEELKEGARVCKMCGGKKPLAEFPIKSGYHIRFCEPCYKARVREHSNSEKGRANQKRFYESHPGYSAAQMRKWSSKNPERLKANQDKFLQNHPNYYRDMAREKAKIAKAAIEVIGEEKAI